MRTLRKKHLDKRNGTEVVLTKCCVPLGVAAQYDQMQTDDDVALTPDLFCEGICETPTRSKCDAELFWQDDDGVNKRKANNVFFAKVAKYLH